MLESNQIMEFKWEIEGNLLTEYSGSFGLWLQGNSWDVSGLTTEEVKEIIKCRKEDIDLTLEDLMGRIANPEPDYDPTFLAKYRNPKEGK